MIELRDLFAACLMTCLVTAFASYMLGHCHGRLDEIDKPTKADEVTE